MCHHKNNELGREIGDEYHAFLIVIMKTLLYIDGKEKIGQGYHKLVVTIVSITTFDIQFPNINPIPLVERKDISFILTIFPNDFWYK